MVSGLWDQIPQFYSVDTQTPYTSFNSPLPLDDATQRAIQNGQATLSAYLPLASQFDLRERRNIGTFSVACDTDAAVGREGRLHHDAARRRIALGRQLRIQQRRRGGAAVRLAHERLQRRHRVDERPADVARRLYRLVVQQPRRHARVGQPAPAGRFDERARPGSHGVVAIEFSADHQRCRLHEVRASYAAHGLCLVRILEQRRAAATVHDQPDASADRTSAGERRGRGACLFDEPRARLASAECIAVHRPRAPLRLRESDPGDADPGVHQLRHLGKGRRPLVGRNRTRTAARTSMPTRFIPDCRRWR